MMAQSDGNDETDGTSGVATWTHTDEMTHRWLAVTDDLEDRSPTPKGQNTLKFNIT